jgi:hypothetical protein
VLKKPIRGIPSVGFTHGYSKCSPSGSKAGQPPKPASGPISLDLLHHVSHRGVLGEQFQVLPHEL